MLYTNISSQAFTYLMYISLILFVLYLCDFPEYFHLLFNAIIAYRFNTICILFTYLPDSYLYNVLRIIQTINNLPINLPCILIIYFLFIHTNVIVTFVTLIFYFKLFNIYLSSHLAITLFR